MERLDIPTERGSVLTGVLFPAENADTVVIAIAGIHGNFYSNPFYYNIGAAETIGSWNERFSYTDDDISAYLNYAAKKICRNILCCSAPPTLPT